MAETSHWKVIVLMGIPGSGKGTQAQLLTKDDSYVQISTGDLFRNIDQDESVTEEEKIMIHKIKEGQLVPDSLVFKIAFHAITLCLDAGKIPVLDGAIRTLEQAKGYESFFEEKGIAEHVAIVEIAISDDLSLKRLTTRKVCANCGYIVHYSPENFKKEICDQCGGAMTVRSDDHPEIVQKRLETQGNRVLQPILEYYKSVGHVFTIDGSRTIPVVDEDVRNTLGI